MHNSQHDQIWRNSSLQGPGDSCGVEVLRPCVCRQRCLQAHWPSRWPECDRDAGKLSWAGLVVCAVRLSAAAHEVAYAIDDVHLRPMPSCVGGRHQVLSIFLGDSMPWHWVLSCLWGVQYPVLTNEGHPTTRVLYWFHHFYTGNCLDYWQIHNQILPRLVSSHHLPHHFWQLLMDCQSAA